MTPYRAPPDCAHQGLADTVLTGNVDLAATRDDDVSDGRFGEFRGRILLTKPKRHPVPRHNVVDVVPLRPGVQVHRVDAGGTVTGVVVLWRGAIASETHQAVGEVLAIVPA